MVPAIAVVLDHTTATALHDPKDPVALRHHGDLQAASAQGGEASEEYRQCYGPQQSQARQAGVTASVGEACPTLNARP
ncbi:hypothetical protein STRCI_008228 [Streptomyces cinnabarinus]|uniref:Uncharacterized protein n=1 Tax=Streptomyces cinnabarinus TaxID=67287 RepID=A0ABY7KRY6_9ACTN|nr:hypothetical protein [Streptomyces cinnabarinus]WAZ27361.1 hypothetical protein STRCI_008228 [Streptomyces cinnabarinus]